MELKVLDYSENKIDFADKKYGIKMVGDTSNIHSAWWGFEIVESPEGSLVHHSNDALGDTYLNYGDDYNIVMAIKLSQEGTYKVKFVCRVGISRMENINVNELDDAGNLIATTVPTLVVDYTIIKSSVTELIYNLEEKWT